MIPVLAIPTLNRTDLLIRCLKSIDNPIERLVVVNNSGRDLGKLPWNEIVVNHPNAGVAGSWNEVIKLFPAPYWILCNDDIEFTPGALAEFERAIAESHENYSAIMANHNASLFAVTRRGVEKVGLFDENFYPAYCEDLDWLYRSRMIGEKIVQAKNVRVNHGVDGVYSQTIHGGRRYQSENDRTYANNAEYYRLKWGGNFRHETFTHPFNDPNWPVDMWRYEPKMRELNQWKI
jgi:GT2 family glycosyltransferase